MNGEGIEESHIKILPDKEWFCSHIFLECKNNEQDMQIFCQILKKQGIKVSTTKKKYY